MKVALVTSWPGGAVYNVLQPLVSELQELGVDAQLVHYSTANPDEKKDLYTAIDVISDCDLVHYGWIGYAPFFKDQVFIPATAGIHHIPDGRLDSTVRLLLDLNIKRVVVSELFSLRQLGQVGWTNTTIIPYVFDHSKFRHMPPPANFTVGVLGCDYALKRFSIAKQAAKIAKVQFNSYARDVVDERVGWVPQDNVLQFYKSISCYIETTFDSGGSLPPQEALLCGRPVIATHVGMMPQIIKHGVNGVFFDGGVSDCVKAIDTVQHNYDELCDGAMATKLPLAEDIAPRWVEMWEEVLSDR